MEENQNTTPTPNEEVPAAPVENVPEVRPEATPVPVEVTPEPVQEVAPVQEAPVSEDLPTAPVAEAVSADLPTQAAPDQHDIQENMLFAILSYISFLCLVPLFTKKDSPFARFHAKQGFVLFFMSLIFVVMMTVLKTISPWTLWRVWNLISNIGWIAILIMSVIGVMHVVQKHSKELPFIGHLADPLIEKFKL